MFPRVSAYTFAAEADRRTVFSPLLDTAWEHQEKQLNSPTRSGSDVPPSPPDVQDGMSGRRRVVKAERDPKSLE